MENKLVPGILIGAVIGQYITSSLMLLIFEGLRVRFPSLMSLNDCFKE
jgi:hypothetical protein